MDNEFIGKIIEDYCKKINTGVSFSEIDTVEEVISLVEQTDEQNSVVVYNKLLKLLKKLKNKDSVADSIELVSDYIKQVDSWKSGLDEKHVREYPTEIDNSFFRKLWNLQHKSKQGMNRFFFNLKKKSSKSENEFSPTLRVTNIHKFLDKFLVPISMEFIFFEYKELLKREDLLIEAVLIDFLELSDESSKESSELRQKFDEFKLWISQAPTRWSEYISLKAGFLSENYKWADTVFNSYRSYSAFKLKKHYKQLEKKFKSESREMTEHTMLCLNLFEKSVLGCRNNLLNRSVLERKSVELNARLEKDILPKMQIMLDKIESAETKLNDITESEFHNFLKEQVFPLIRELRETIQPKILDAINRIDLNKLWKNVVDEIESEINTFPESIEIFQEFPVLRKKKKNKFTFFMKDLVSLLIFDKIKNTFNQSLNDNINLKERMLRSLVEIDEVINYNSEAAEEKFLKENDLEFAVSVLKEGFLRAKNQSEQIQNDANNLVKNVMENCNSLVTNTVSGIEKLTDLTELRKIHRKISAKKTQKKIIRSTINVGKFFLRQLPFFSQLVNKSSEKIQDQYNELRRIAGLTSADEDKQDRIRKYLIETKNRIDALPFVYQRLFKVEPLENERFFSSRESELQNLIRSYNNWANSQPSLTAIIGEKGAGKTSLLRNALHNIDSVHEVIVINFDDTIQSEEVLSKILSEKLLAEVTDSLDVLIEKLDFNQKKIIVCENIHQLFVRKVDGFDLLEKFIHLMHLSQKDYFWIVTANHFGWLYLQRAIHIEKHFRFIVKLPGMNPTEIFEIIMKRHRASGYMLYYSKPEILQVDKKLKKLSDEQAKQDFLQKLYFDNICTISGGNIMVSLLLWMRSISEVTKEKVIIKPLIGFEESFLHDLEAVELFALTALLQHENLNAHDLADILTMKEQIAEILLKSLLQKGVIIENNSGFQIHPFLYRPIISSLNKQNLLY